MSKVLTIPTMDVNNPLQKKIRGFGDTAICTYKIDKGKGTLTIEIPIGLNTHAVKIEDKPDKHPKTDVAQIDIMDSNKRLIELAIGNMILNKLGPQTVQLELTVTLAGKTKENGG